MADDLAPIPIPPGHVQFRHINPSHHRRHRLVSMATLAETQTLENTLNGLGPAIALKTGDAIPSKTPKAVGHQGSQDRGIIVSRQEIKDVCSGLPMALKTPQDEIPHQHLTLGKGEYLVNGVRILAVTPVQNGRIAAGNGPMLLKRLIKKRIKARIEGPLENRDSRLSLRDGRQEKISYGPQKPT